MVEEETKLAQVIQKFLSERAPQDDNIPNPDALKSYFQMIKQRQVVAIVGRKASGKSKTAQYFCEFVSKYKEEVKQEYGRYIHPIYFDLRIFQDHKDFLLAIINGLKTYFQVTKETGAKDSDMKEKVLNFFKYSGLVIGASAFVALPFLTSSLIENELFHEFLKGSNMIMKALQAGKQINQQEVVQSVCKNAIKIYKLKGNEEIKENSQVNPDKVADPDSKLSTTGVKGDPSKQKPIDPEIKVSNYFAYFQFGYRVMKNLLKWVRQSSPQRKNQFAQEANYNAISKLLDELQTDPQTKPLFIFDQVQHLSDGLGVANLNKFLDRIIPMLRESKLSCYVITTDNSIYSQSSIFNEISEISYLLMPYLSKEACFSYFQKPQLEILMKRKEFYENFFTKLTNIHLVKSLFQSKKYLNDKELYQRCQKYGKIWRNRVTTEKQRDIIRELAQEKILDVDYLRMNYNDELKELIRKNVLFYDPGNSTIEIHYPYFSLESLKEKKK